MKVLGNKLVRAIAFITACALLASAAFIMCDCAVKNDAQKSRSQYYQMTSDYSESSNTLFVKLWTVANMYMRNLDSDGKFSSNKYLKASTEEAMKSLGLMDGKGNVTIDGDEDFEYILKYGENSITNTDRKPSEFSKEYSFIQQNDVVYLPTKLDLHEYYNMSWYTTNFGMTYFTIKNLSQRSIAIFDFDTSKLPFYYDENGAKIYYKEDGTTPVPKKNSNENDYDENELYNQFSGEAPPYEQYGSNMPYSIDDKFEYISGDDRPICIYLKPKDDIVTKIEAVQNEYNAADSMIEQKFIDIIPLIAAAFAFGLFFVVMGGYDTEQKKFILKAPNQIFTEFYLLIAILAFLGAGSAIGYFSETKRAFEDGRLSELPVYYAVSYAVLYAAGLFAVNAIVVQLKCRSLLKTSLFGKLLLKIVNGIKGIIRDQTLRKDPLTRRFLIRTGIAVVAEVIAFALFYYRAGDVLFFISLLLLGAYIYLAVRDLRDINKLSEHISAMQSGDYMKVKVPETSVIYGMTKNLNEISDGMQTAVEKRVQSERMKIDLVTNVSHDLKTPLTSIISYIDLLGSEEMSPEARDYVKILDEKSARLKVIVSDLFDLAKATSGTDVAKEKLDMVILTQQVIGDMGDKIEKYGRDVRTELKTDSAPIEGDGKRLYRVMQNLIDNALKYSLEGTRIYITVNRENTDAVITVKNISAEEMNFTADEITERFARGDSSRSTEGSGLGLSIAKSFTEANGGQFNVTIDGDMFTAEVRLPIIE